MAVSCWSLYSCIESETKWDFNPLYFPGVHDRSKFGEPSNNKRCIRELISTERGEQA